MGCCIKNAKDSFPSPQKDPTLDSDSDIQGGPGGGRYSKYEHGASSCYEWKHLLFNLTLGEDHAGKAPEDSLPIALQAFKAREKHYEECTDFEPYCFPQKDGSPEGAAHKMEEGDSICRVKIHQDDGRGTSLGGWDIDETHCLTYCPLKDSEGKNNYPTTAACLCAKDQFLPIMTDWSNNLSDELSGAPYPKTLTLEVEVLCLLKISDMCFDRDGNSICELCTFKLYGTHPDNNSEKKSRIANLKEEYPECFEGHSDGEVVSFEDEGLGLGWMGWIAQGPFQSDDGIVYGPNTISAPDLQHQIDMLGVLETFYDRKNPNPGEDDPTFSDLICECIYELLPPKTDKKIEALKMLFASGFKVTPKMVKTVQAWFWRCLLAKIGETGDDIDEYLDNFIEGGTK